ncbi:MAG: hypothetical protein AVDCRST_MAG10-3633, partial [uncultured Acidimicrobiales bacterium]
AGVCPLPCRRVRNRPAQWRRRRLRILGWGPHRHVEGVRHVPGRRIVAPLPPEREAM